MIDISHRSNTLRYAVAEGSLYASSGTLNIVQKRLVPQGDALEIARIAGIAAAKKTADLIIFCHTVPIDWVEVNILVEDKRLRVVCEVRAVSKTDVEMQALTGATAALLNAYDILRPLDKKLAIGDIKIVDKTGGDSSFQNNFDTPLKAAILIISDSIYADNSKDKVGNIIKQYLQNYPIEADAYEILPDDPNIIQSRLEYLADKQKIDLILTTGGTGLGANDLTPEATKPVIDKIAPGIAEAIRVHGINRTPYAMLSREIAGLRGESLIINLPGSSNGVKESLDALFPGLLHAFKMIKGGRQKQN